MELKVETDFKTCSKCNRTYTATEEYFYKQLTRSKKKGDCYKLSSWCRECTIKKNKQYRIDNLDEVKEYDKFRYRKKEDYYKSKAKRWSKENIERKRENYKEWVKNNPDKLYEYGKERRMNKTHEISDTEWFECLDYFNNSCAYCGIPEVDALEVYGHLLHKEHVEHNGANDITNCVPACRECNSKKWEFDLNKWYNKDNPIYSKRRYNKIVKWLMSFSK